MEDQRVVRPDAAQLWQSCRSGDVEKAKAMIDGVNEQTARLLFLSSNWTGMTAMHHACQGGHTDLVKLFIQRGAPIQVKNKYGDTPCQFAACQGHLDLVELLVGLGANVHWKGPYPIMSREPVLELASKSPRLKEAVDRGLAKRIAAENRNAAPLPDARDLIGNEEKFFSVPEPPAPSFTGVVGQGGDDDDEDMFQQTSSQRANNSRAPTYAAASPSAFSASPSPPPASRSASSHLPPLLSGTDSSQSAEPEARELLQLRSMLAAALQRVDKIIDEKAKNERCVICYKEPKQTVLVPCGHMCSCSACAHNFDRCPICRRSIDLRQRVYK